MKRLPLVLVCLAFAFSTLCARADLDPRIGMGDPNCSSYDGSFGTLTNVSGPFVVVPADGGGKFAFCNTSGTLWTQFDVVVPIAPGVTDTSVTCDVFGTPAPFAGCQVSTISNFVDIFFLPKEIECNGNNCGIPNDFFLLVDLNCLEEFCEPWPPGTALTFDPNGGPGDAIEFASVPEPASLLLLGAGIAAIGTFRRRRRT